MNESIRVLVLEDRATDAELMIRELRRAGYDPEWRRIETEADFLAALDTLPDLILSDHSMPQFDSLRALNLLRNSRRDIPFILISGTLGEEVAVESMKLGATDYLLKDRIARLGHAVQRALGEKRLREKNRQSEQQMRLQSKALENAANAITITDRAGRISWVNPAFTSLTGFTIEDAAGKTPRLLKSGKHDQEFYRNLWQTILSGQTWRGELINRRKDGSLYFGEQTITPVMDDSGRITHFIGIMNDVTARKQAEEDLRRTHAQLRHLLAHSPAVIYTLALGGEAIRPTVVSENIEQFLGVTVAECSSFEWWQSSLHPEDRERVVRDLTDGFARGGYSMEYRIRHKDGSYRWIEDNNRVISDAAGRPNEAVGVWTDITGRKRLEVRLQESERRFRDMMDKVELISMMLDRDARITYCNDYFLRLTGWQRDEVVGQEWFKLFIPPEIDDLKDVFAQLLADSPAAWHHDNEILTRSGEKRLIHWNNSVLRSPSGEVIGTASIGEDITERKHAEEALRASEERFRELAENVQEVFWITDPAKNKMLYISPAYETIWGRTCQSLYDSPRTWIEAIHPDDRDRILEAATTKQMAGTYDEEYRIVRPDGAVRWIRDWAFPVRNARGEVERVVGVARDISETRQLEEQLRQSQKMEAIGQLAGGVAHDFNNILAAMMMQTELIEMGGDLPGEAAEGLQQIRVAAERAATLTRQLLLFSRRQVMQPRELDLNEVVTSLAKMLQRIIGEDVRLQLSPHPAPLITRADAGMLDQVLMNLAVNARDAMLGGGRLLIETAEKIVDENLARVLPDVTPGRYVWLSVSDTGQGIPPEVMPKIFEPFFTTKEPGKGTGLGMATVFGIVKQHRGWLKVYSEQGRGTNIQIFLPATAATAETPTPEMARPKPRVGTETILLAEDDASVRLLTRVTLERYGYTVLEAGDGVEALKLWEDHRQKVALLLTDLVMPSGMSGQQLSRRLRQDNPDLKVIYTSGYSAEIAGKELELRRSEDFLQKPFPPDQLLETVRRSLDG